MKALDAYHASDTIPVILMFFTTIIYWCQVKRNNGMDAPLSGK